MYMINLKSSRDDETNSGLGLILVSISQLRIERFFDKEKLEKLLLSKTKLKIK